MGSVDKRRRRLSDGELGKLTWRARYRDTNRRPRSRSFARRFDAERFLETTGSDLQRGEWVDPVLRRSSFADWAYAWWATTVKLRPNTRRGYWLLLKNHVLPYFGGARLGAIDYLDVETFIAEKLKSGHGPKQVREMVTVLSLILKCAIKANARKDNPAAGHELRVPRRRVAEVPMLTMEQAAQLVGHTSDHYKAALWLLIFTGMRPAELCGLRVEDVDLVRRTVHIRRTLSPVPAYDGGPREHVVGPAKSEAGQRTIPIPKWLCAELATSLAKRGHLRRDDPLIVNKLGRPVNPRHVPRQGGAPRAPCRRPARRLSHIRYQAHARVLIDR